MPQFQGRSREMGQICRGGGGGCHWPTFYHDHSGRGHLPSPHPPNAATANDLINDLLEAMDIIAMKHPNAGFVLMGDFNELDGKPLTVNRGFVQVVENPTRGQQTLDKTLSDIEIFLWNTLNITPIGL